MKKQHKQRAKNDQKNVRTEVRSMRACDFVSNIWAKQKKKVYIFFIKSKNLKTKSQARIERKYAHTKKNSRKLIQKSKKACGKNPQRADFFPESILHVFLTKNRKVKKKKI